MTSPIFDDGEAEQTAQSAFSKLKPICVALMGTSALTPSTIAPTLDLLNTLLRTLKSLPSKSTILTPSLIQYVFFPISTILRRNPGASIPNQVLEKILRILAILCDEWWWTCDVAVWEQVWMLAGSVLIDVSVLRTEKGKGKERDDETKEAAVTCLLALLRDRSADEDANDPTRGITASERFQLLRRHALEPQTLPILGQTLSSLLSTSLSLHIPLQLQSLELLQIIIVSYFETRHIPSFLPGTVSTMCKIALGEGRTSYQRGEVLQAALQILSVAIIKGIGDDVCREAGLIRTISTLDDLRDLADNAAAALQAELTSTESTAPLLFSTPRSTGWYRATASQLHLSLNSLTPLLEHSNPLGLLAFCRLNAELLLRCTESLSATVPLFLSNLLALSTSRYDEVSSLAFDSLATILPSSPSTLSSLLQSTYSNLSALPRILPSGLDRRIQHLAGQIEAACRLGSERRLSGISTGVGQLLGPNGGIEKWGISLLHALEFVTPSVAPTLSASRLLTSTETQAFPPFMLRNVTSLETMLALERMLRALGSAGGEESLFAVEWFVGVARRGRDKQGVAALWCAGRLIEGVGDVILGGDSDAVLKRGSRLLKTCKWISKSIAELWDDDDDDLPSESFSSADDQSLLPLEHTKGISHIQTLLDMTKSGNSSSERRNLSPALHAALALQLLALASQILAASFAPLFLYVLYPVLHSLVSPVPALSSTALCTLQVIAQSTGYASPANLLLSNFDYALDAVSRRLTKTRLDLQATKVLVVLVKVVGKDVVEKAGDVVEECFDRLDEFHGYARLVEGLMEVLTEVVSILEAEHPEPDSHADTEGGVEEDLSQDGFATFCAWYSHRNDPPPEQEKEDFGPTPQAPWAEPETAHPEEEAFADSEKPPPTASQALSKQIVGKSLYFLTHGSPLIRARVLSLLSASVPLLPESDLFPNVHSAWPFVLNRLEDPEPFVACEAAFFIQRLTDHFGASMTTRIWDDVWPRFRRMLDRLSESDSKSALARRGKGAAGTETVYSASHRLYRSMLSTMKHAVVGVQVRDHHTWEVGLSFRRFLQKGVHEELQDLAKQLFVALGQVNADAIWLMLSGTVGADLTDGAERHQLPGFLKEERWDIIDNVRTIMETIT